MLQESSGRNWSYRWWSGSCRNRDGRNQEHPYKKSLGSNNKQNVVLATIEGLRQIKTPEAVAKLRGKTVEEILG